MVNCWIYFDCHHSLDGESTSNDESGLSERDDISTFQYQIFFVMYGDSRELRLIRSFSTQACLAVML